MARNGGNTGGAQARQTPNENQINDPVAPDNTAPIAPLEGTDMAKSEPQAAEPSQSALAQQASPALEPIAFLVTGLKPKANTPGVVTLDLETPDGKMGIALDLTAEEASDRKVGPDKLVYVYPDGTYTIPDLPPMQVARPATIGGLRNTGVSPRPPASAEMDVLDTTATISYPKREHTIIVNGEEVTYLFEQGKPRRMPAAHAMKFVKYPAFQVTDPATGKRFEPIADPAQRQVSIAALAPNQVIASLDELTPKALLHRCHTLNGGERYGANSDTREMIAFIIAASAPQQAEGGTDEMDADQLDKMFS